MSRVWWTIKSGRVPRMSGFSVVELLLAATVFGVLSTGLIGAVVYGRESNKSSTDHDQALFLAGQGLEAARNIANSSYALLTAGSHGVSISSGQWTLTGTTDTTGIFTRTVTVSSAGTNRLLVTSNITWPEQGSGTGSVTLSARIVNWEANIKLWSAAVVGGSANPATTTNGVKVSVQGNYAYMVLSSASSNFVVFNITNPAAPTITSTTTFGGGTPTNIFVSGNYAYVTTGTNTAGLEIINISNPAAPTLTKAVSLTGAVSTNGVYVSGNYAYLARNLSGAAGATEFTVVNVATPASAAVVGTGYDAGIQMNEIWVSGNYAYVATSSTTNEMVVVNITNPLAPTSAAVYNPSTSLTALTITGFGSTVLLGMGTVLDAVNITTPTAPVRVVGSTPFTSVGTINDVDVDITNQYAFIGTTSTTGEIQVVNIASLTAMTLSKTVDVTGTTSTVTGVSYASTLDVLTAASASDTQELVVVNRN